MPFMTKISFGSLEGNFYLGGLIDQPLSDVHSLVLTNEDASPVVFRLRENEADFLRVPVAANDSEEINTPFSAKVEIVGTGNPKHHVTFVSN